MTRETVDAWVLARGEQGSRGQLQRSPFAIPELTAIDALVEPLIGSWEANMDHALSRTPIDVCAARGEDRVVLGNGGLVRVLEVGGEVTNVRPGDLAIVFGNDVWDDEGYMVKALAYDSPGSMGVLAKRSVVKGRCLIPIPAESRHSLEQWAAFSLRYVTAWANWRIAYGAWKLQLADPSSKDLFVLAWGGGTSFAELTLARHSGAHCFMAASSDERIEYLENAGIQPLDRRAIGSLDFRPGRYKQDADYRADYDRAEQKFLEIVMEATGGRGASIFVDFVGAPVIRATIRAVGREGVVTSAGWKAGMTVAYNRAAECIKRSIHVHTHFARYEEGVDAVRFAEENAWMPEPPFRVYDWEDVPALAEDYAQGRCGYFPLFRVNQ